MPKCYEYPLKTIYPVQCTYVWYYTTDAIYVGYTLYDYMFDITQPILFVYDTPFTCMIAPAISSLNTGDETEYRLRDVF